MASFLLSNSKYDYQPGLYIVVITVKETHIMCQYQCMTITISLLLWIFSPLVNVFNHASGRAHGLVMLVCQPLDLPLWSGPKYLNNYRIDCHEFLYGHLCCPELES